MRKHKLALIMKDLNHDNGLSGDKKDA